MKKLKVAVTFLLAKTSLPPRYKDHALKGMWKHHRELHLEPDWLLVYKVAGEQCTFDRTGAHADLFGI